MALDLKDKVVIVTGASSGIGQAIAQLFAARGARVTLCGRDQSRLQSVYDQVVQSSGGDTTRFLTVLGDLTEPHVRQDVVDRTVDRFGRLDVLVANAGVSWPNQKIREASEQIYDLTMDTNLRSVFFLIQAAVPHLEKTRGNIVTVSTVLTFSVSPQLPIYSMSKSALDCLTRCLAADLGTQGIRVNSVHPGLITTRLARQYGEGYEELVQMLIDMETTKQPLQGRKLTALDVAEVVAFLASDSAALLTGVHVKVDGGRSFSGFIDLEVSKI